MDEIVNIDNNIEIKPKHAGGRPLAFKTVAELDTKIQSYFDFCDNRVTTIVDKFGNVKEVKQSRPYTLTGLAYFLGVDRQTLLNYKYKDEYFGSLTRAKQRCEMFAEEQLFEGNDRGAKFSLTNNYDKWSDKQEIDMKIQPVMFQGEDKLKD